MSSKPGEDASAIHTSQDRPVGPNCEGCKSFTVGEAPEEEENGDEHDGEERFLQRQLGGVGPDISLVAQGPALQELLDAHFRVLSVEDRGKRRVGGSRADDDGRSKPR